MYRDLASFEPDGRPDLSNETIALEGDSVVGLLCLFRILQAMKKDMPDSNGNGCDAWCARPESNQNLGRFYKINPVPAVRKIASL
jgi:hypothetical protein